MCGIAGITNTGNGGYSAKDIQLMTDIVRHRGPDDAGFLLVSEDGTVLTAGGDDTPGEVYAAETPYKPQLNISGIPGNSFRVALGHRRLSIQDLTPLGHCPLSYKNGRYWITFNGEIYNFPLLKEELELLGHHFISHTDTEVILAAYDQWGTECVHRLQGMWAFAIYDIALKELFFSRDRFGIKPLYYWVSPGGSLCFASEIKQFTQLPDWKAKLNKERTCDYLLYNVTDHTDETMFTGVYHVLPGHCFKCNINHFTAVPYGKIALTKWYDPKYTGSDISFAEAAETFEKLFRASVKKHLIADVPVGAALSGGLDSSSVVCEIDNMLKNSHSNIKQKTFSYTSSDERYNEQKWIDEVLKQVSAEPHFVGETGDIVNTAVDLIWYNDEPTQSQSEMAAFFVYRLAKENNIKVVISGKGADEYLSGYKSYRLFRWTLLLKKGQFWRLNKEIRDSKAHINLGLMGTYLRLCYFFVPTFVKKIFRYAGSTYKIVKSIVDFDKLGNNDLHPYDDEAYAEDSIFKIASRNIFYNPLPKFLRYEDRMSMANSVESRVPFLDHELVEFTMQQKADYLDAPGEQKKILLHGLKKLLPPAILSRKTKIGFITSEEKWVRQQMTPAFRKLLEESIAHSHGILKPGALDYFDKIVAGTEPFDYTYWRLIAFGLWMKTFNVQLDDERTP